MVKHMSGWKACVFKSNEGGRYCCYCNLGELHWLRYYIESLQLCLLWPLLLLQAKRKVAMSQLLTQTAALLYLQTNTIFTPSAFQKYISCNVAKLLHSNAVLLCHFTFHLPLHLTDIQHNCSVFTGSVKATLHIIFGSLSAQRTAPDSVAWRQSVVCC